MFHHLRYVRTRIVYDLDFVKLRYDNHEPMRDLKYDDSCRPNVCLIWHHLRDIHS